MNLSFVALLLFGLSVFFGLIYSVISMIGASWYDFQQVRRLKDRLQHPFRRIYRAKPLVTVLIPAHNEELVIKRCLDSLIKNTYRKYEIIVVDDASKDATAQIVMKYICDNPTKAISLLSMKRNMGKAAALNQAMKRQARGEIFMTLDADCMVSPDAIANAVRHFVEERPAALAPNVRIMDNGKILGILQQFEFLGGFRSKKFNHLSNSEYIIGGAGAMYTRDAMSVLKGYDTSMWTEDIALSLSLAAKGNKQYRINYASDVLVYTEPVSTFQSLLKQRYRWKFGGLQAIYANRSILFAKSKDHSRMLTWVRLPMAVWAEIQLLLEPLYFSYFAWLAFRYQNPTLFIIAWITMTGFLWLAIWGDEHMSLKRKAKMTFIGAFMYYIFYVMTVIQVFSAFKTVINYKKIVNKKLVKGTWVSPERIGETL